MNNPIRILVVDDVPVNVQLLSRLLQREGYHVLSAGNGVTAYNMAMSYLPDLILLDVMMPEMDGFEVCRALKAEDTTSEIPIIFVTAKTETMDTVRGFDMGGVDYVTKPFVSAEVLARVRTHLKLRTMRDEKLKYHSELLRTQKLASITTLAGGIAHNINNMIGTIIGYADMLQDSLVHDEKTRRYISRILEASQGVADLTRDLLTYARAGRSATMSGLSVTELMERMVQLYKAPVDYRVDMQIPADIPDIWADQYQILQAISNIFVNAQEAISDDGTITITASTGHLPSELHTENWEANTDEYVIISISDTGSGMDEETIQKVFEPFFTTKQTIGSGLGLSAAYGIVQKHGGIILVDTEPGKGSTFHVYLPTARQHTNTDNTSVDHVLEQVIDK
jgi:signal transduction histidine kinase